MSRLVKTMLTSLVIILLFIVVIFVIIYYQNDDTVEDIKDVPIAKIDEYSYQTPEITTDLKDGSFVRIQFQIILNSKQAKKEISQREFQVKNILIKELVKMKKDYFKTEISGLERILKEKTNELMIEGKVLEVLTTNKILQ